MKAKLDIEARLEIIELLSRYCHLVDSNEGDAWAALFTEDGVFDVPKVIRLAGTAQLRSMPGVVATQGAGKWRHQITNVVAEPGDEPDTAIVRAYGLATDWARGGAPFAFSDYRIILRRVAGLWRIANLVAMGA